MNFFGQPCESIQIQKSRFSAQPDVRVSGSGSTRRGVKIFFHSQLPFCDTNIGTRDRSFLLEKRCLSDLLWLNGKIFLIGTNGIQKFENLACSHNFFRFLIALQLFLINFQRKIIRNWPILQPRHNL